MNAQHTPGEWNAKDSEVYSLTTGHTIARCDIGGKDETTEANARLIAAAPTMLAALQKIVDEGYKKLERGEIDNFTGAVIETAKQAIQKATQP